jgi:L-lactate dehydrogenase complex protein LldG
LPQLTGVGSEREDLVLDFARALQQAAGTLLELANGGSLDSLLESLPQYKKARSVCSMVAGVRRHNLDPERVEDIKSLYQVDLGVVQSNLGVAENGAVWVEPKSVVERGLLFLCEHVVVLLPRTSIVADLHRAYETLTFRREFGCFISGPSKTADIEQALVIGAHGPRSLSVVLV